MCRFPFDCETDLESKGVFVGNENVERPSKRSRPSILCLIFNFLIDRSDVVTRWKLWMVRCVITRAHPATGQSL